MKIENESLDKGFILYEINPTKKGLKHALSDMNSLILKIKEIFNEE